MDVLTQLSELDVADMMIAAELYESSESLIVNYRYTVLCVNIMEQENEIFVVLKSFIFILNPLILYFLFYFIFSILYLKKLG
jgi:hypothetical protein